jgi:bifunctional non-homologous end joining protein LigD
MSLTRYRQKRDFSRTAEPRGQPEPKPRATGFSFVIQKHDATRLHYDFRLELDGVLLSWAVPKGPSLDPAVKRLAVQTEDHPIEYGGFEGVIPDGEYGAGPVQVWDQGQWVPEGDPRQAYARGRLSFELQGQKLHGSWHLVRTRSTGKVQNWLLMKSRDAAARSGEAAEITAQETESALSGRGIEAIESEPDRLWHSGKRHGDGADATGPEPAAGGGGRGAAKAKAVPAAEGDGRSAGSAGKKASPAANGGKKAAVGRASPAAKGGKKAAARRGSPAARSGKKAVVEKPSSAAKRGERAPGKQVFPAVGKKAPANAAALAARSGKGSASAASAARSGKGSASAASAARNGRSPASAAPAARKTSTTAAARSGKSSPPRTAPSKTSAAFAAHSGKPPDPSAYPQARKAALPDFIPPQLATLVSEAPAGDDWLHEIKLDGYRLQLRFDHRDVKLLTRRGHDWSARMPHLLAELQRLTLGPALIDGELVVLHQGRSDFQRLQNSLSAGADDQCVVFAFDLLQLGTYDLRKLALRDRKALLAQTLTAAGLTQTSRLRLSEHVIGRGPEFFAQACKLHVEGSVAKRIDAPYESKRSHNWLKIKCLARQEFVIGGFSKPEGSRQHFGALLLGVHEHGGLQYAGRVGTGFSRESLAELHAKLVKLASDRAPFANPPRGADAKDVQWVEPRLVAEVEYAERTSDGLVRHAAFRGLREDKPASAVHDEKADPAGRASKSASAASKTNRVATSAKPLPPTAAMPALRSVRLTHPDRVVYPGAGVTKADLALYYALVAERMLPHVANRPLMLVRCPEGQTGHHFHQKHLSAGMGKAIKAVTINAGEEPHAYIEDVHGLMQLVQMGVLEIHAWGSRVDDLERPDQLTFDLDPDEGLAWPRVVEAARSIKARLTKLGLHSFLKTTGGKGLHVVVPIVPRSDWDAVKAFCKDFADAMVREQPDRYLAKVSKRERKGKILIDYLRNGRGATAACAYSTRARPGAPVAAPLTWDELTDELRPDQFNTRNLPARLSQPDPWADFEARRSQLPKD